MYCLGHLKAIIINIMKRDCNIHFGFLGFHLAWLTDNYKAPMVYPPYIESNITFSNINIFAW